jgi:hypothetical protein
MVVNELMPRAFIVVSYSQNPSGLELHWTSVADPDPDLNKFSTKFLLEIFWRKYALKSLFMNQKVKQQRFLKYLWFFLLRPGSGSARRRQDPDPTIKVWIRPDPDTGKRHRPIPGCELMNQKYEIFQGMDY